VNMWMRMMGMMFNPGSYGWQCFWSLSVQRYILSNNSG
jgi:hypothetical protein